MVWWCGGVVVAVDVGVGEVVVVMEMSSGEVRGEEKAMNSSERLLLVSLSLPTRWSRPVK